MPAIEMTPARRAYDAGCRRCTSASSVSGPSATTCRPSTRSARRATYVAASAPRDGRQLASAGPVQAAVGHRARRPGRRERHAVRPSLGLPAGDRHPGRADGLEEVREQVDAPAAGHHARGRDRDGLHVDGRVPDEVGDRRQVVRGEVRVDHHGRRVRGAVAGRARASRRRCARRRRRTLRGRRRPAAASNGADEPQPADGPAHGSTRYWATTPTTARTDPARRAPATPATRDGEGDPERGQAQQPHRVPPGQAPGDEDPRPLLAELAGRLEQPVGREVERVGRGGPGVQAHRLDLEDRERRDGRVPEEPVDADDEPHHEEQRDRRQRAGGDAPGPPRSPRRAP